MTRPHRILSLLLVSAAAPSVAHAQVDDPDQAADAIFQRAKEEYAAGDYAKACPKFAAVHTIDPGVGSALYKGDCYEKQGRMASARAAFAEAKALAKERGDGRLKVAAVRYAGADALAARLRIELPDVVPSSASIDVDELTLRPDELGEPLVLDEGPHVIIFRAPGFLSEKVAKEVKDGGTTTLRLAPLLEDPDAAWQITPLQVGGLVVGAAGIGGLIVGGAFGARALSSQDEYQTHCNGQPDNLCRASATPLFEDAQTQATVSTVGFVAGGLLLGAGVTMFIVGNDGAVASPEDTAIYVRVAPRTLALGGSF